LQLRGNWGRPPEGLCQGVLTSPEKSEPVHQNFTLIIGGAGVPDAGSTFPLLSFASLGLVALRRDIRIKKAAGFKGTVRLLLVIIRGSAESV
jgi:hypothetical protein